ncbi:hypothetical protein F5050DRAFT_1571656 [Lentinula boryana]|uniref:Uncharacterized protein n=1 Tax=Lentinula boryana TaxID=40481 RepID=A0ABQ8QCR9_9AGAR|nr:hypothetical protein F5050DRAFT_1571656 [Lentinula boryana]
MIVDWDSTRERSAHVRIRPVLNNLTCSGVLYSPGIGPQTAQGYNVQFGVHVLGHCLLTRLLMPTLLCTAKGEVSGKPTLVHVVSVSSDAHEMTAPKEGIVWDSLKKVDAAMPARKELTGTRLYGQSKLVRPLSNDLLEQWYILLDVLGHGPDLLRIGTAIWQSRDQGVVAISLHPGACISYFQYLSGKTVENILWAGGYLTAWVRRQVPSKHAQNPELRERLWKWCEEQVSGF